MTKGMRRQGWFNQRNHPLQVVGPSVGLLTKFRKRGVFPKHPRVLDACPLHRKEAWEGCRKKYSSAVAMTTKQRLGVEPIKKKAPSGLPGSTHSCPHKELQ